MAFRPLLPGALLAVAVATAAQAANPTTPSAAAEPGARLLQRYDDLLWVPVTQSDASGTVSLRLKAVAKVWTLMGEPVVYCSAAWTLEGARLDVAYRGQMQPVADAPREVLAGIGLVQATVGFPLYRKGQSWREIPQAWVPCDLGAINDNGDPKGSFNVPGSPDWSRLLLARQRDGRKPWDDAANYLGAADAKALLASGQYEFRAGENGRLNDGAALRFEFDFSPLRGWLAERHARREAEKLAERRRQRELRAEIIRRQQAGRPGAASAPAAATDPFDTMVAELDDEAVVRAERSEQTQWRGERGNTAERRDARRRVLARKGCADAASATGIDLAAAAERAEQAHERCASAQGVTAFLDKVRGASLYGYKRPDGSVLIAPRFDRAYDFSDGLGRVRGGGCTAETCYVNAGGSVVLSTEFSGEDFHEGLAAVYVKDKKGHGYIDRSGRLVIPARYARAEAFKDGRAEAWVHLRSTERTCSGGYDYYDKGAISREGAWVSGPREERVHVPQICLTKVPSR